MCEKEPKRKSCTECPQYDGMTCAATDMVLGEREQVLQEEHRRGFICLDTGEAELKGDAAIQWTAEQERLCQEKGYKSVQDMWAAEGKQVKAGFLIDEGNEHLEPMMQISNGPGPVKLTFQYEENVKSVDDTMYHPNSATADCIADMLHKGEGGPFTNVFTAGSPSSECPSRREGPPQKGKTDENKGSHNALRLSCIRHPDARCDNCKKSQKEDGKPHCYQWGIQILMPHRPCEKWARDPAKSICDDQNEVPSLYKEGMSSESLPSTVVVLPGNGINIGEVSPFIPPSDDAQFGHRCETTFTDQEIAELTDALRTVRRILEQHGVTL